MRDWGPFTVLPDLSCLLLLAYFCMCFGRESLSDACHCQVEQLAICRVAFVHVCKAHNYCCDHELVLLYRSHVKLACTQCCLTARHRIMQCTLQFCQCQHHVHSVRGQPTLDNLVITLYANLFMYSFPPLFNTSSVPKPQSQTSSPTPPPPTTTLSLLLVPSTCPQSPPLHSAPSTSPQPKSFSPNFNPCPPPWPGHLFQTPPGVEYRLPLVRR